MPVPEAIITVIREWLVKAEHDLLTAAHTLKLGVNCPTDTVCFHAQQCVEKYVKALLVLRTIPFPKTHDVRLLVGLLPARLRPKLESRLQDRLTQYATVTRYPGHGADITLAEARQAVAIARRVRKDTRKRLPRAALRRRTK